MKWPWQRPRSGVQELTPLEVWQACASVNDARLAAEQARYDALLERYHELASRSPALASAPSAPELQPIDTESPPDVVLAAMRKISPVRDKTYDANWSYWEANKDRAAQYPADFAAEILSGN